MGGVLSTNKHNDTLCIIYSNERTDQIHFWYFTLCYASKLRLPYHTPPLHYAMAWQAKPRYATFEPEMLLVGRCCFSSLHFNLIEWDGLSLVTFTFSLSYTFSLVLYTTQHSSLFHSRIHVFRSPYYSIPHHLSRVYDFQFSFVRCPKLCLQFNL